MADLSALSADKLAAMVNGGDVLTPVEAAALAELQTRANRGTPRENYELRKAAEKERDEALTRVANYERHVEREIEPKLLARAEAAEARLAETREALKQIAALDGGYPDDYCAIARAALTTHPEGKP